MAPFPEQLIKAVQAASDDEDVANYDQLYKMCNDLCRQVISKDHSKLEAVVNAGVGKAVLMARVIVEAARRGLSSTTLKEILPTSTISSAIIDAFHENEKAITECLMTIGWEPPRVVDISWKLSRVLECNDGGREKALAEIHFDTLPTGSTDTERISFHCNTDDLQNILWKLREAENTITNLKNFG